MKRKVVLTCAVTGDGPLNPRFTDYPISPEQIANSCLEAACAGASVVHIHARNPETGIGDRSPALFREIVDRVKDHDRRIVINLTTGMGASLIPDPENEAVALPSSDVAPADERVRHVADIGPEICSLDVTTMNMDGGIADAPSCVYMNTPNTLRKMARLIQQLGVRPEIEVFNPGDILLARQLIDEGLIGGRPMIQLCLGVKWSAPADIKSLLYMKELLPDDAIWSAFGVSRHQMPMVAMAAVLGGNCRVGLEDNIYLEKGVFASNGQLVEKAKSIIDGIGYEVASPDEARDLLEL
jgi:uncharacterized protein (DUF849 family)